MLGLYFHTLPLQVHDSLFADINAGSTEHIFAYLASKQYRPRDVFQKNNTFSAIISAVQADAIKVVCLGCIFQLAFIINVLHKILNKNVKSLLRHVGNYKLTEGLVCISSSTALCRQK